MSFIDDFIDGVMSADDSPPTGGRAPTGPTMDFATRHMRDSPFGVMVANHVETASIAADDFTQFQVSGDAVGPVYLAGVRVEETAGQDATVVCRIQDTRADSESLKANPLRHFTDDSDYDRAGGSVTVNDNDIFIPFLVKIGPNQVLLTQVNTPAGNTAEAEVTVTVPAHESPATIGRIG